MIDAARRIRRHPLTLGRPQVMQPMAKPNYSFEKRQRELAKKKKQDEKDARKQAEREAAKAKAESDAPAAE